MGHTGLRVDRECNPRYALKGETRSRSEITFAEVMASCRFELEKQGLMGFEDGERVHKVSISPYDCMSEKVIGASNSTNESPANPIIELRRRK